MEGVDTPPSSQLPLVFSQGRHWQETEGLEEQGGGGWDGSVSHFLPFSRRSTSCQAALSQYLGFSYFVRVSATALCPHPSEARRG